MNEWPVEHEGREYQPLPETWLDHPRADDPENNGPRCLAVSCLVKGGRILRVRYAHPVSGSVIETVGGATSSPDGPGYVPAGLVIGSGWPRTFVPTPGEPSDTVRSCEREHLRELWADRLDDVEFRYERNALDADPEQQLIADGGTTFECDLCGASHSSVSAALQCCSDQFDDDDFDGLPPLTAPDSHGCPVVTDGGQVKDGIEQTRVGHCKADETDVYAGRGPDGRSMLDISPGLRGWLGNPFSADEYGREECIEKFREAFEQKLRNAPVFRRAVRDFSGKNLGCWCQRLDEDEPACHAEVIGEWADRLADDPELMTDGGQSASGIDRVAEVLVEDFAGTVVCDGRTAYPAFSTDLPRCWAHILREAEDAAEKQAEGDKRVAQRELESLTEQSVLDGPVAILLGKIKGCLDHWLTFDGEPAVFSTNNAAENALREPVVPRKFIGTLRNDRGMFVHEMLLSLLAT